MQIIIIPASNCHNITSVECRAVQCSVLHARVNDSILPHYHVRNCSMHTSVELKEINPGRARRFCRSRFF